MHHGEGSKFCKIIAHSQKICRFVITLPDNLPDIPYPFPLKIYNRPGYPVSGLDIRYPSWISGIWLWYPVSGLDFRYPAWISGIRPEYPVSGLGFRYPAWISGIRPEYPVSGLGIWYPAWIFGIRPGYLESGLVKLSDIRPISIWYTLLDIN